jgi:phage terminase large subunit-like protein
MNAVVQAVRVPIYDTPWKSRYVQSAVDYAKEAIADDLRRKHGKLIRSAAKRFLNDLERAQNPGNPFWFSEDIADLFCEFIETLPHVEGRWEKPTLELTPADLFFVVQLFGFRAYRPGAQQGDHSKSIRRFSTALYAVARKNGKSTKAAAIIIACFCLERELGMQVLTAATTGSQARIVWGIAKKMLEKRKKLRDLYALKCRANDILRNDEQGGILKPINSKASTQDGLNPAVVELDELHAHQTHDLLNVLQSAAGGRSNPLWLITTTEGYENPGPWAEQRNFAEQVLEGVVEADHYLAIIYRIDDEDDDFDETKWIKANPLMEQNPILLTKAREAAIEAKSMPGKLAEFKIKRLNRRASTALGFVDLMKWRACAGNVDLKALEKKKCWAAFDLASVNDMNAWRLLWEIEEGELYATWGRFWVPEAQVVIRKQRNTVPYVGWKAAGHITVTPGEVADYDLIAKEIIEDYERFNPEQIAYDPWNATQFAQQLDDKGLPVIQFVQGTKSYNPAMKAFERIYLSKQLVHDNNPVLTWNMANLVAREDINKNIAPDRKRGKDKIDGAAALIMACGLMEANESSYVTGKVVTA